MNPDASDKTRSVEWTTLDRYLAGESGPGEREVVAEYLRRCPEAEGELRRATTFVVDPHAAAMAQAASWDRMEARIRSWEGSAGTGRASTFAKWRRPLAIAAFAGVVIAGAGMLARWDRVSGTGGTPVNATQVYATQVGQRATVVLPDGSRAILGPATRLRARQTDDLLDVRVDGEALFSVAHSARKPFVVRTRQSATRVLGTTFLVRQYGTERVARVVVADGRVAVRSVWHDREEPARKISADGGMLTEPHSVLTANSLAFVNDSGQIKVVPNIRAEDYTAWTNGQLVFRSTPLRDVVADLGRAYGVEIRLSDSTLGRLPVDWNVHTTRYTLSQVLPELLLMMNAHARESDRVITIIPGRPAAPRSAPVYPSSKSESQYGR